MLDSDNFLLRLAVSLLFLGKLVILMLWELFGYVDVVHRERKAKLLPYP